MTTAVKKVRGRKQKPAVRKEEEDPWFACKHSSHIPNAETIRAIEEGMAEKLQPVTLEELSKMWDDEE